MLKKQSCKQLFSTEGMVSKGDEVTVHILHLLIIAASCNILLTTCVWSFDNLLTTNELNNLSWDSHGYSFAIGMPTILTPYTSKEDGIKFIKELVLPHPWFRAICLDNKPIGAISVSSKSGNDRCRGELGYVLGSKYWRKGIATQAVKMVVDTIFKEWTHLERLEALVDVNNVRSQRVLEKDGFQKEGVLRKYIVLKGRTCDMVMYSLLSTDRCQT